MREITLYSRKAALVMALASAFALASCTTQPVEEPAPPVVDEGQTEQPPAVEEPVAEESPYKGFVVQLIASAYPERAEEIKVQFEQDGYNVFVNPLEENGQTLYRVQIGPYGTEQDAERVLVNMKRRYPVSGMVTQAIIKENP